MSGTVCSKFGKGEIGGIGDHLRNHVHLTNCIHLKNHMHMRHTVGAHRNCVRDLIALERSQSLRDFSTSPLPRHSPPAVDPLVKKGRRSLGGERGREGRRLLQSSMPIASLATSKVGVKEVFGEDNGEIDFNELSRMNGGRGSRRNEEERMSKKTHESDFLSGSERPLLNGYDLVLIKDLVSREVEPQDKKISYKRNHGQKVHCEQLKELSGFWEDAESCHIYPHERRLPEEKTTEEVEAKFRRYCSGLSRLKRHKLKGVGRAQSSTGGRNIRANNELSVASNSLPPHSACQNFYIEGGEQEDTEPEVTLAPKNGCGVPWNWSRIQDGGKTFLDFAGRNLSRGLSDSKFREGKVPNARGLRIVSDKPVASDHWRSYQDSDSDELPLLIEPSVSQESTDNAAHTCENLGELRIFASHSLEHSRDYNSSSKVRMSNRQNSRGHSNSRHLSLTQKYMPKTFKDLVGQKLVVQALSNAVVSKKIGLLYVFYGPHGTGKTSCAHIFAKALNCHSAEHPKPCGSCNSCIGHEMGKNQNVQEVGPVDNFDFNSIMDLLESMNMSQFPSQHRVLIIDDCDSLPPDSWRAISKVIDIAPQRVVFILVSTSLDNLPHIIISRCQKFFFPKLKSVDMIHTLQRITVNEDLEIDKDALKLIASQSDGSLSNAEMILDQLGLIGRRISVPLVQELVGLISDEKLVDLLDLALSADTVNTVKSLREIVEAGVEPLALMSQLATVISDILAGSYVFSNGRLRRKFFRKQMLSKEVLEKLRQALKTLSEAERQLRVSSDRLTWLTAVLLQLAPDHQYALPNTSTDPSFSQSPMVINYTGEKDVPRKHNGGQAEMPNNKRDSTTRIENLNTDHVDDSYVKNNYISRKKHVMVLQTSVSSPDITRASEGYPGHGYKELKEIWFKVLEKMQSNTVKKFMRQEGKLISIRFGAVSSVHLIFSSQANKSKAENFRGHILQAFASVLGSPLTIEISCEPRKDMRVEAQVPHVPTTSESGSAQFITKPDSSTDNRKSKTRSENYMRNLSKDIVKEVGSSSQATRFHSVSLQMSESEIVKIEASEECGCCEHADSVTKLEERDRESWLEKAASFHQQPILVPLLEKGKFGEQSKSQSIVRRKVSLADIIKQARGYTLKSFWSRPKVISIAKKLEQDNLRLESRSRSLLCWKVFMIPGGKLPHLRFRARKPRSLLKLIPCARYLCASSPR
ncbi:hypothetical protein AAC387_Pa06g0859 [Persea americana]